MFFFVGGEVLLFVWMDRSPISGRIFELRHMPYRLSWHSQHDNMKTPCRKATVFIGFLQYFVSWWKKRWSLRKFAILWDRFSGRFLWVQQLGWTTEFRMRLVVKSEDRLRLNDILYLLVKEWRGVAHCSIYHVHLYYCTRYDIYIYIRSILQ